MLTLRAGTPEDIPAVFEMLVESAKDQGFPNDVAVTERDLLEDGFGPNRRFELLIADWDSTTAGMALYFFNYSTWGSRLGLYVEDLYVAPSHRRLGIAKAIMRRLARIAVEAGCRRMHWTVHRENERALLTYEALGAKALTDWILMSLKDAGLERTAD
jgi:GNAT superfamily N-acetyltransferase